MSPKARQLEEVGKRLPSSRIKTSENPIGYVPENFHLSLAFYYESGGTRKGFSVVMRMLSPLPTVSKGIREITKIVDCRVD